MNWIRSTALGIWLAWVVYMALFPNWQQAAERETDYRKDLGVHFVLTPPAPVEVPCYFVGCITAPPSYFHILIDRRGFYPALASVTALLILALALFRKNGSTLSRSPSRMPLLAASLIALALPLPGSPYFPLGSMVAYLPTAILNPNHDHISVLIGFPFFFAIYGVAAYFILRIGIWANRLLASES